MQGSDQAPECLIQPKISNPKTQIPEWSNDLV